MKKNITTKEIAKMANVSIGTVDRVLHGRPGVATKTKEKIIRLIKEVDYTPNVNARNLALNKTIKVSVLFPDFCIENYWELPLDGVHQAIKEYGRFGISVKIFHFEQDKPENFLEKSKIILNEGTDVFVFAPVFMRESSRLCKLLDAEKISYLLVDANLQQVNAFTFIGQDAHKSGFLAAKLMQMLNPDAKNVILNVSETAHNNIILKRIAGFKDYYTQKEQEVPAVALFDTKDEAGMESFIFQKMEDKDSLLNVFIPHSRAYLIANIVEKHVWLKGRVQIIGFDLLKQNKEMVKKGLLHFIIHQKPELQGYKAIESVYRKFILKEEIDNEQYMSIDIVTKENIDFI